MPRSNVALAITYHDPPGRMSAQIERALPTLAGVFGALCVQASPVANQESLDLFTSSGALVQQESANARGGAGRELGRLATVALALRTG